MRAVGFDLDGTLFDHRGSAVVGVDAFLRMVGVDPSEEARRLWFSSEDQQFELFDCLLGFRHGIRRRGLVLTPRA